MNKDELIVKVRGAFDNYRDAKNYMTFEQALNSLENYVIDIIYEQK